MPIDDDAAAHEIRSARRFDAPPPRVFDAFRDPTRLARWWGPTGWTNEFHEFDLRPGGRWRFEMRGPGGERYPMEKEFLEVVPDERLVLRHHDPAHGFVMTMTYAPDGGGTLLTWRMRFDSAEECARVRDAVVAANEQNFDRLRGELRSPGDVVP